MANCRQLERTAHQAAAVLGADMFAAYLEQGRAKSLEEAPACARDVTAGTMAQSAVSPP